MKILMLCDRESALTGSLQDGFQSLLAGAGHDVASVTLSREDFKPCLGCFGCWVKTPGRCVAQNDGANCIAEKQMNSDAVLLLTKITYGGFSADIKSYLDRSIQNIASDFEVYKGEMRHKMRYTRFPAWIALGYGDASEAERQTFAHLTQRNALNMRPDKFLSLTIKSEGTHEEAGRSILEFLEEGI